jgi:hypothetical protein
MFHMDKVAIKGEKGVGGSALVHFFDTMKERKRRARWVALHSAPPFAFNQSGGENK